jgi:hypothetical protein
LRLENLDPTFNWEKHGCRPKSHLHSMHVDYEYVNNTEGNDHKE